LKVRPANQRFDAICYKSLLINEIEISQVFQGIKSGFDYCTNQALNSRMENVHSEVDGGCPPDATNALAQSNVAVSRKRRRRTWRPSTSKTRLRTIEELDQRTHAAQKAKQLVSSFLSDIPEATVGQHELIKRAAILGAFIEDCETRWLRKEPVAVNEYLAAINAQRRVLVSIGLERRARDCTSLGEVLRQGNRNEVRP
jgi:hypothetical protein